MRIDKFLKTSRLIKRRTLANEACGAGRVVLNGRVCKPGAEVEPGDIVEIRFGSGITKIRVLSVAAHVPKDASGNMYEFVT
jgi:ribosomal 50S subunit-recycling heat shock protein